MLGHIINTICNWFCSNTKPPVNNAQATTTIKTETKQGNPVRKPELIDLHFNGLKIEADNIDCSFWDKPSDEAILKLRKYLFDHNVKAFLPTLITDSAENIEAQLAVIDEHRKKFNCDNEESSLAKGLAYIPGVHIEGGYISRTGTHPEIYKEALGPQVVEKLAKKFPGLIKIWTICPLVDKDGAHVNMQRKYGITPSYGHSNANYQEAMDAFNKHKVKLVTHWGNGMNIFMAQENCEPYNREEPNHHELSMLNSKDPELLKQGGLGKAAFDRDDVYMMGICGSDQDQDYHISPKLIKKLAETNRLILVTDAVARPGGSVSENNGCQKRGYQLIGGRVALDKHTFNAKNNGGLTDTEIHKATIENPSKILTS